MERAILEYVANSAWQVPLLAGMAWLAIWLGRPGARMQHRLWVMTLALSILLPLVGRSALPVQSWIEKRVERSHTDLRSRFDPGPRAPKSTQVSGAYPERSRRANPSTSSRQALGHPEFTDAGNFYPAPRDGTAKDGVPAPLFAVRLSQSAVDWLLGIYFTIILLRLVQLAFAGRTAGRLLRQATERKLSPIERTILDHCCKMLRVRRPRVLISRDIRTPMTMGGIRPALLLPETFPDSTESEMTAILLHELAHVRRRDCLANWLCQLGSLPIAYHPATHGVQRRIRRTRELVCDAMAAETMNSSVGYARCLVTLAQRMLDEKKLPQAMQTAGLFDHDVFEERIMRLLETKNAMDVRAKMVRVVGAVAVTAAMTIAAAVFHVTPTVVRAAQRNVSTARTATPAQVAKPAGGPVTVKRSFPLCVRVPVRVLVPAAMTVPVRMAVPVHLAIRAQVAVPVELAVAVQAANPAPAPIPALQTPVPKVSPTPIARPARHPRIQPPGNPQSMATPQNERFDLTPEQRARMEADMAAAREQMQRATKTLQSPEFKKQMADMQAQMKDLNSAVMQWRMEMLNSPEFKKQMSDMQRTIENATRKYESDSKRMHTKELDRANRPNAQSNQTNSGPK